MSMDLLYTWFGYAGNVIVWDISLCELPQLGKIYASHTAIPDGIILMQYNEMTVVIYCIICVLLCNILYNINILPLPYALPRTM